MARPLRIEYPGAFYHVVNRGQRQEPIVLDHADRIRFVSDLERMAGQFHVLVHSYCLMTNPCDEAVAGSVLGTKPFLRWVEDTFLSARQANPEIPGLKQVKPVPSVEAIVQAVAEEQQVSGEQILARGHQPNRARDIALYLCRELSGQSCRELGRRFGGISGAAITMRHQALGRRMRNDRALTQAVARLRERIADS